MLLTWPLLVISPWVSAEYLASTDARISFVSKSAPVAFKDGYDMVDAQYAEGDTPMERCDEFDG